MLAAGAWALLTAYLALFGVPQPLLRMPQSDLKMLVLERENQLVLTAFEQTLQPNAGPSANELYEDLRGQHRQHLAELHSDYWSLHWRVTAFLALLLLAGYGWSLFTLPKRKAKDPLGIL